MRLLRRPARSLFRFSAVLVAVLVVSALKSALTQDAAAAINVGSRSLLFFSLPDRCLPPKPAIEEFPEDWFTQEQRLRGGILVHVLITVYMFGLLSLVCDEYFVVSLYHICSKLELESDVAGATFMAVGSSAPTLFISVVSIFFAESAGDIGLGTIVGSTIFNTLFIIAICGMCAGRVMQIAFYPLLRDSLMYTCGTLALILTIRDRTVTWWEATSFIFVYAVYVVIMYFNKRIERFVVPLIKQTCGASCEYTLMQESVSEIVSTGNAPRRDTTHAESAESHGGLMDSPRTPREEQLHHEQHEEHSQIYPPKGTFKRIGWCLGLPVILLFQITIPPCCKRRWSDWYLVTFFMSVMWMGFLSYILVWMICVIGFTYRIPDCVMGMTLLAAGSSIPDVLASVIVAKQGEGDMAISNAIGSNVFDMLCLGLPWLMKTAITSPGSVVLIQSQSIFVSSLLLVATIIFTNVAMHLNDWNLDRKLGVIFLIVYIATIGFATVVELIACPCNLEL